MPPHSSSKGWLLLTTVSVCLFDRFFELIASCYLENIYRLLEVKQIAVSIELLLFFHSPDFCEFGIKIYNK